MLAMLIDGSTSCDCGEDATTEVSAEEAEEDEEGDTDDDTDDTDDDDDDEEEGWCRKSGKEEVAAEAERVAITWSSIRRRVS